jgi:predicted Rossmann fold nucleotide-binding protein DprA/Smf involved in DNA uptake
MSYKISKLSKKDWPPLLEEIPSPPLQLNFAGTVPDYDRKFLCIVGARKYSQYGQDVVNNLVCSTSTPDLDTMV